ncbi:MAG: signal peptidase I [Bacillota bacterium]
MNYNKDNIKDKKKSSSIIKEMIIIIVLALVIAFVIKGFIIDSRIVPTPSMYPTVHVGDRVLMNRLAYIGDSTPQRGDIVVFTGPEDAGVDGDLLKRVIGLPGDVVEVKNNQVYINNEPYQEDYLAEIPTYEYGPVKVPSGHYFMMGDNRNKSADSHYWQDPFIDESAIKGKVFLLYWPLERLAVISSI